MVDGRLVELIVNYLCTRTFLADFTFLNPRYRKQSGLEKEACDLFVVFESTAIAIQVKAKGCPDCAEFGEVENSRVARTVEDAITQFRGLLEVIKGPVQTKFINGRGHEMEFDHKKISNLFLIVIFAGVKKESPDEPISIKFEYNCLDGSPIPTFVFPLQQFSLLTTLCDTISDFLRFLDILWALNSKGCLPAKTDPIDIWSLATFEPETVKSALFENATFNPVGAYSRLSHQIPKLEAEERMSYCVDFIIEILSSCIGTTAPSEPSILKKHSREFSPNSLQAHLVIIPYLARLDRKERSQLGQDLLDQIVWAASEPMSFRAVKSDRYPEVYLVLAARLNRNERQIALANVSMAAATKFGVTKVIGIAAGPRWPIERAVDVMITDVTPGGMPKHIVDGAAEWFSEPIAKRL